MNLALESQKIILSIQNLRTVFKGQVVHDDLNLDVREGELIAVMGPSGSGKTSFLNFVIGDSKYSKGNLLWHGEHLSKDDIKLKIGFAFQIGGLLSDMTIVQNIAMPLIYVAGLKEAIALELAMLAMSQAGLPNNAMHKYPEMVSGGMYKKAVIAKSIALGQNMIVLDEPLSGLDPVSSQDLMKLIHSMTPKVTIICVTHNFIKADRYAILHDHKLIVGTLEEVEQNPLVSGFINSFRQKCKG